MSADRTRPRVALSSAVLALVPAELRDRIDVVELAPDSNHGAVDLAGVQFLAPGARNRSVAEQLPRLSGLQVFQTASAGTDWVEPILPAGATLCNARGARDGPVAEWVLGALLGASSGLLERAGAQTWERRELDDLAAWTVLIVGMGSIGRAVAAYLQPIGSTVVGVASRSREDLHGVEDLPQLLPTADAVVLLTPLTDRTRGLIGAGELAAMRDGALLVNAARGAVVDTDALVSELSTGRLRAVLDVTEPEPLPAGHPLWSASGLLSRTPHIAGASAAGHRAANQLAAAQLGRWLRGEPLVNVVIGPGR
jgi:phosphoglycerate dehydrogenase-like enzyme